MKFSAMSLGLLLIFSTFLQAIDFSVGNYTLKIFEDGTHFSLSSINNTQKTPLFYSNNPRTSSLQLSYNNSIIRLGEAKDLTVGITEGDRSITVAYELRGLLFEQEFFFLQASSQILGVEVIYRITNNSPLSVNAEIRNIIDTHLGEEFPIHLSTLLNNEITSEYGFVPNSRESYIISTNKTDALGVYLVHESFKPPEEVVVANWKRLSEAAWRYNTRSFVDFDYQPFSVNDSAVMLFFGPEIIPSGKSVEYKLVFSHLSPNDDFLRRQRSFTNAGKYAFNSTARTSAARGFISPNNGRSSPSVQYSSAELGEIIPYVQDIKTLEFLTTEIDDLLGLPTAVDPLEIRTLEEILETIKSNSKKYQ